MDMFMLSDLRHLWDEVRFENGQSGGEETSRRVPGGIGGMSAVDVMDVRAFRQEQRWALAVFNLTSDDMAYMLIKMKDDGRAQTAKWKWSTQEVSVGNSNIGGKAKAVL